MIEFSMILCLYSPLRQMTGDLTGTALRFSGIVRRNTNDKADAA
jgi:hypothetical protein